MATPRGNAVHGGGTTDEARHRQPARPLGEAPYTGANRIRFEGTLSAGTDRHPRFSTCIQPRRPAGRNRRERRRGDSSLHRE
ncbi:Hypothetical protein I596_950 [Dokdonella koreensis DS-123]|uniref:Uncharacterized protein n=1 Tax=Dokdonella koreensis DS-123 TaxID=1300342 RepID=A0A160DST5_9GAMM|nr:Hypothetical protein I596_950 [Dokdonella koreensis DS-123]